MSISPTFYEQLLCQNPFTKKLQTQIAHKSCAKKLSYKKAALKILEKLTLSYQYAANHQSGKEWDQSINLSRQISRATGKYEGHKDSFSVLSSDDVESEA